jgi:hypothetical protein
MQIPHLSPSQFQLYNAVGSLVQALGQIFYWTSHGFVQKWEPPLILLLVLCSHFAGQLRRHIELQYTIGISALLNSFMLGFGVFLAKRDSDRASSFMLAVGLWCLPSAFLFAIELYMLGVFLSYPTLENDYRRLDGEEELHCELEVVFQGEKGPLAESFRLLSGEIDADATSGRSSLAQGLSETVCVIDQDVRLSSKLDCDGAESDSAANLV